MSPIFQNLKSIVSKGQSSLSSISNLVTLYNTILFSYGCYWKSNIFSGYKDINHS